MDLYSLKAIISVNKMFLFNYDISMEQLNKNRKIYIRISKKTAF